MGRKQTLVGTQVSRVIEDNKLPNSVRQALVNALFKNGEIVDHVLDGMLSGMGMKAEALYRFAEAGNYVHGLPSGQFRVPGSQLLTAVKAVLDVVHGASVTMDYAEYGPPNSLHIGWMKLMSLHNYNPATNELPLLSAEQFNTVYLEDMVVVVPTYEVANIEPLSLQQWGISPRAGVTPDRVALTPTVAQQVSFSQVEVDIGAAVEHLRVEYTWVDNSLTTQHESFSMPVDGYDDNKQYIHARYTVGGTVHYLMYEVGSGTYTALDELFDAAAPTSGNFFPFMYFRYGKVSEAANPTSESYLDNKRLMKFLGIDFDQMAEAIDANPDIDDVEQAMMMFAVPAVTENQLELRYLWSFFHNLFMSQGSSLRFQYEAQADIANSQLFGTTIQPPGIVIQDQRFKMSLSNRGVYKIFKSGDIAEVGGYAMGTSTFNVTTKYWDRLNDLQLEEQTPISYHYYRKQVTKGLYEELQVVELQTRFHINGEYSTIGDDTDKILIIPLDHSITEEYTTREREILYSRSLHYVFNSLLTVKLAWYQTETFQVVMIFVAFVITAYSMGGDGGSALSAAMAAGTAATFEYVVTVVLQYLVARLAFKLFVKAVGVEAAFVIAIVAAIAGVGFGLENGGLAGSPWAENLLALSNGLSTAIQAQITADTNNLAGEISEFEKYVEEQTKLLEETQALLRQDVYLSPFVIFGEKPGEFYNRTIHSGNIGVVGINAIHNFVDAKLTLPTVEETLGRSTGEDSQNV